MIIREMQIDDLEQVISIEEMLFSRPWTLNGFFSFFVREDALFLVAEEGGEILGYCGALTALDEGDVLNVGVRPERQRQGIGRRLIGALARKMDERGVASLYLEVRVSNQAAIDLYEASGFKQVGLRKGYYDAPKEDAAVMCRAGIHSNKLT